MPISLDTLHILSTKKLTPEQRGSFHPKIELVEKEFIRITPVEHLPPHISAASLTLFTSKHAVRAVYQNNIQSIDGAIFCVGEKTDAWIERCFQRSANRIFPTAQALAQAIIAAGIYSSVHFYCGNLRRDEIPNLLHLAGIACQEIIVYHTHLTPHFIHTSYDAILFFSPSAIKSYLIHASISFHTHLFVLGSTTYEEAKKYSQYITMAAEASTEAMIVAVNALVPTLINTKKR